VYICQKQKIFNVSDGCFGIMLKDIIPAPSEASVHPPEGCYGYN